MLGIHENATTMTITVETVQMEARKVNLTVRNVMIQPGFNGQLEKQGAGNGTGTGTGTGTGAGPERYRITSLIRAIKWV